MPGHPVWASDNMVLSAFACGIFDELCVANAGTQKENQSVRKSFAASNTVHVKGIHAIAVC